MPARAAERFIADVARSDPERLRARSARSPTSSSTRAAARRSRRAARRSAALDEDTLALRAIEAITARRRLAAGRASRPERSRG